MPFTSTESVIVIPSLKFYRNWKEDRGNPSARSKHKWCHACSQSFLDWYRTGMVGPEGDLS